MSDVVTIQAPAKVNLALAVGPPGADGMHPICSWMVTVGLYDDLTVTRLPDDRLSRYAILWHEEARRTSDINWSITRDLAVRAHLALERRVDRSLPVQLKLDKRIPVGGGLGGGSSDAAAMLHAVNALFELGLSLDELTEVAADLGSDVPFLVRGGSAIVSGLGEQLDHHDEAPDLSVVVVLPDAACPTGEVYRRFDEIIADPLRADAVRALPGALQPDAPFNDLARPARDVTPALDDVIERVSELAERPAHVSGSGAAIFVLCDDPLHAEYLAREIEARHELPAIDTTTVAGPTVLAGESP